MALFIIFTITGLNAKEAAREILKYSEAVITVKITSRYQMEAGGREMLKHENVFEATGTVISPDGLSVLSLANTDPTRLFTGFPPGLDMPRRSWGSSITDIKMVMADGEEIPAEVLLRDKDLDLIFIRPKVKRKFVSLDLSHEMRPEVMEPIFILSRLGRVADRSPFISLAHIQAIVEKPRLFYVSSLDGAENGIGAPVFTTDGKIIGIVVLRIKLKRGFSYGNPFGGISQMGILPVILPAKLVLEVARQAEEVK